jgi:hypothetical protein
MLFRKIRSGHTKTDSKFTQRISLADVIKIILVRCQMNFSLPATAAQNILCV